MDTEWTWSEVQRDYYRYKPRQRAGKSSYDLIWGRSYVDPPPSAPPPNAPPDLAPVAPPIAPHVAPPVAPAPAPLLQPQYRFYPDPSPSTDPHPGIPSPFIFAPSPQPSRHTTTRQLLDQHNSIAVELVQRGNPPAPPAVFPISGFVVPRDYPLGADHSSSASTEGPRAITPTTTVTQSPSVAEAPWPRNPLPPPDNGPETSVFQARYPTPDGRYETIQKPRNYFKKGRVFKVVWVEPRGEPIVSATQEQTTTASTNDAAAPTSEGSSNATPGTSVQTVHAKPRLFVVVRQKSKHCLCVPVYTYSHQATSKPGINPEDHAPLISEGTDVIFHPQEKLDKLKKRLLMVVEDASVQWSPLSRINFSKVHSVEYNLKVRTIGRIAQESTADLEAFFREAIGLGDE